MTQIEKICLNYINFKKIGNGRYGMIYKAQNKETKYDVAIKEIDKQRYSTNILLKEKEIMNKMNENSVLIKEIINSKDYIYIIMELCYCNLEEYIMKRQNNLSINEIKEVLIQLNNNFKIIEKEKIIYRDLKVSNILLSINKIIYRDLKVSNILLSINKLDKCIIKLNNYNLNKILNESSMSLKGIPLTISPEILKGENINNNKCDIWSLGIIIYFMLFKEYPYNGKNEILLMKDIMSKKELKLSEDNNLNDLMNKMLKIDINERISWEDYFNHPFFKEDLINLKCNKHNNNTINYYCKSCKNNICDNCIKEHPFHEIIPFNKIGLNKNEMNTIEDLLKDINDKLNNLNKIKENIENYINKIKLIKENTLIYENDNNNNYK